MKINLILLLQAMCWNMLKITNFLLVSQRGIKKGYIELPTKLEDNLVFENKNDHLWHTDFDDVNLRLLISKRLQHFEPILTVSMMHKLRENFKSSFILELYWENKIDYEVIDNSQNNQKYSLIKMFRKFFSKKIRMIFN